jgi:2-polyprenyl-6-hydroxyphenyl methylase/3-demethylubiquinone-9 3-methyltransferase
MQAGWATFLFVALTLRGRNPIRVIRDYPKTSRGMSWWIDIGDWIGGYPFEVAAAQDVIDFLKERGFEIRKMQAGPPTDPFARPFGIRGTGSICYLFEKV